MELRCKIGQSERQRLLLLVASGVFALLLGFVVTPPQVGARLIGLGGYFYILTVFVLWIYFGWRIAASSRCDWTGWISANSTTLLFLVAATAVAAWTDSFGHKLLFDDHVLQGTAWHMHATKEVATPIRGYEIEGTWTNINTFL